MRITDDSINVSGKDAKADIYVNPDSSNWGDSWGINRQFMNDIYKDQYITANLTFDTRNGVKFFVKDDSATFDVASYRRVTSRTGEEFFLKDDTKYYTTVFNNTADSSAYIVVDQ